MTISTSDGEFAYIMRNPHLYTLITGASGHSSPMIIIRHIVNQIFVLGGNLSGNKHDFVCSSAPSNSAQIYTDLASRTSSDSTNIPLYQKIWIECTSWAKWKKNNVKERLQRFPRDHGTYARENLDPNQSSLITRTSQLVELCHVTDFRRHLETKTEDVRTSIGRGWFGILIHLCFICLYRTQNPKDSFK